MIVVSVLAIVLGLLVGTLNHEMTSLDLFWVQINWPLGLLMLAALSTGLIIGLVFAWLFKVLPLRVQLRRVRRMGNSASGYPDTTA